MEEDLKHEIEMSLGRWGEMEIALDAFHSMIDSHGNTPSDKCDTHISLARDIVLHFMELQRKTFEYILGVIDLARQEGFEETIEDREQVRKSMERGYMEGLKRGQEEGGREIHAWIKEHVSRLGKLEKLAKAHGWEDGASEGGNSTSKKAR